MPRLNDFVPQVRDAARSAVQALLPFAAQDDLLFALGFTWRLRHFSRLDHSDWIASAQIELAGRLTVDRLRDAMCGGNPMVARGAFFLLMERDLIPRADLLTLAVESGSDIAMSRLAIRTALSLQGQERTGVLRAGLKSQFGVVRTCALRGLLDCAADANEIARSVLLDKQGSVRSAAQFHLRKNGVDLAGFYRSVLQDRDAKSALTCIALSALGSIGSAADIAILREKSKSPFPSVRGTAYLAWLKLEPVEKDAIALAALSDNSRANRKLAASMVRRQGAFIPFECVKEILHGKSELAVLLAFARLSKWDWVETLALEGLRAEPGSPAEELLCNEMKSWLFHASQAYERAEGQQRDRLLAPKLVRSMERLCRGSLDVLHYELELISKC